MAVETRPVDTISKENLFIGLPIVLFEQKLASGAFDVPRNLGLLDSAELAKTVEIAQLRNKTSGLSVLEREVVRLVEPVLNIGMFNFEVKNTQLMLASCDIVNFSASTTVVLNDEVTVPNAFTKFANLTNRDITTDPLTSLDPKVNTLEVVTASAPGGSFGETPGDFALDFPILLITDVALYQETTLAGVVTDRTADLVAGAAIGTGDIGIAVGATTTSGDIDYFTAEAPAAGLKIEVTYTPTFTFTNLTDYVLDPFEGRIRFLDVDKVKAGQVLLADYSFTQPIEDRLKPFTQASFEGKATVKQLTDVGINFIWDIPSVSIRVNDDPLTWNADDFATGSLTMNILADPASPANPFGIWRQFPESTVACPT